MLSSNMLLLNLILLIDVTFSTPTPVYVNSLAWREVPLSAIVGSGERSVCPLS